MLENKIDLNKVKVILQHKQKIKTHIVLHAIQLDYRAVPTLSQTLAYKSQCISKYLLQWWCAGDFVGSLIPVTIEEFGLRISCIQSS